MTDQKCQKWFVKFYAGISSLNDAPWLSRLLEVDSHQTETLRISNITPHGREWTYSKCSKQALKIICTSLIMFITLIFGFHVS